MGRELGRFDLTSGRFDQLAELVTLLFRVRSDAGLNDDLAIIVGLSLLIFRSPRLIQFPSL